MVTRLEPETQLANARFAIVVSKFNPGITEKLLEGAVATLTQNNVPENQIDVIWVPGAWEIPLATRHVIDMKRHDAIVCLGAVIRGETTHDTYINQQVSRSLGQLALESGLPVLFGILTCQTIEQAKHRAGGRVGNKGADCAAAALQMVGLVRRLRQHAASA